MHEKTDLTRMVLYMHQKACHKAHESDSGAWTQVCKSVSKTIEVCAKKLVIVHFKIKIKLNFKVWLILWEVYCQFMWARGPYLGKDKQTTLNVDAKHNKGFNYKQEYKHC